MTYKSIVDKIEGAVNDHAMLYDFGYGQLSDIKVLDEDGDGANYPYAFLVPAGVSRNNQSQVFTFSLIIMEMALTPSDVLTVQSDCIQYLNDIISVLRYDTTTNADTLLNSSTQVFRERFQDDVAGATASFQIAIPDPISACVAPIGEWTLLDTQTITLPTASTFALLGTGVNPCSYDTLNVNQWKYTINLDIEALVDTDDWNWRAINIVDYDTVTNTSTQIKSLGLTLLETSGSTETVNWTQEIQFECSGTVRELRVYLGDSRDTSAITNALDITGTIKREYKTVTP
jgi:hypothetical protein